MINYKSSRCDVAIKSYRERQSKLQAPFSEKGEVMILAACLKSKKTGKLFCGGNHRNAREYNERRNVLAKDESCESGFFSDVNQYTTRNGDEYKSHYRTRQEAYVEAMECGQLITTIDSGILDSSHVNITLQQVKKAIETADKLNTNIIELERS